MFDILDVSVQFPNCHWSLNRAKSTDRNLNLNSQTLLRLFLKLWIGSVKMFSNSTLILDSWIFCIDFNKFLDKNRFLTLYASSFSSMVLRSLPRISGDLTMHQSVNIVLYSVRVMPPFCTVKHFTHICLIMTFERENRW